MSSCPMCGHWRPSGNGPQSPPGVDEVLDKLNAPADFWDPAYWARIDKLTEGTGVYYLDEFRRYLLWWDCTIPSKRVKDRKRQFLNWIKKALARDDYRSKLAAMEGK